MRDLLPKLFVDLLPGFLEPFLGLSNCLFQFALNLLSNFLFLDFSRRLGQALLNLTSNLLSGGPNPFSHTWIVCRFTLG